MSSNKKRKADNPTKGNTEQSLSQQSTFMTWVDALCVGATPGQIMKSPHTSISPKLQNVKHLFVDTRTNIHLS